MKKKPVFRYSNVELLDLIKNGTDQKLVQEGQLELDSPDISPEKMQVLESDYFKYLKYKMIGKQNL